MHFLFKFVIKISKIILLKSTLLHTHLIFFSFFCTIPFIGCTNSHEYDVPSEIQPYVDLFLTEAAIRGHVYDFSKSGLIIEFAELSDSVAGLCHYETPIRIEIDKSYWTAVGQKQGSELLRENLIFHELGHGILGRKHDNTVLANGDWKSIMCGGTKVANRSWNINYRGIRRDYYVDELFDNTVSAPLFSSLVLPVDTTGYVDKIRLTFDSESDAGWRIGNFEQFESSIDNGRYKFVSKTNSVYLVLLRSTLNIQSDFIFEFTIKAGENLADTKQFGMVFGTVTDTTESIDYYSIARNKHFYNGNFGWYSFNTELTSDNIIPNGDNRITVVRSGGLLYYFINNVYVYMDIPEAKSSGYHWGLMVPPLAAVWVENLRIAIKTPSGVSTSGMIKRADVLFSTKKLKDNYKKMPSR